MARNVGRTLLLSVCVGHQELLVQAIDLGLPVEVTPPERRFGRIVGGGNVWVNNLAHHFAKKLLEDA